MGMLQRAEATLRNWRKAQAESGTYTGVNGYLILPVSLTQAETRIENDDGKVIVYSKVVDWLIDATELVDEEYVNEECDGRFTPKPGDRIELNGVSYEVCSIGGERCWVPHGRDGGTYRIHSRLTNAPIV